MADQQDTIFREIDEEMRREQILKLWKDYGTYFVVAAAALILGVGGYQIYLHQQQVAIETSGASYDAAAQMIASGKADEATAALDKIAKDGPAGYAALSQLRLAAAAAKAGKTAEAVAAYDAFAKARTADPIFTDFARLQAAALRLDQADWTEMQNWLIDLTDNSNTWRYSARELMGLAALKHGQIEQARKFNELLLGERSVPPSILERVKLVMATIVATELSAAAPPAAGTAAQKSSEPLKPAEEKKAK